MKFSGNLSKMHSELRSEVKYSLNLNNEFIDMNNLVGKEINIINLHRINCIKCGMITRTSYAQGFCYPCFISAPEAEECVLRPELCRAHEGVARDMDFATRNCLIDHFVYLAFSGSLKVGVTRYTQIPTRWIDQGADQAIIIAKTPNRHFAGCIEVALKAHMSDKTNWRMMLSQNRSYSLALLKEKERTISLLHNDFMKYVYKDDTVTEIKYPVRNFPSKLKNLNFDKTEILKDILVGIKGQYLVFRSGNVLNIRKYSGYLIEMII